MIDSLSKYTLEMRDRINYELTETQRSVLLVSLLQTHYNKQEIDKIISKMEKIK